jgi:hypothetical protein
MKSNKKQLYAKLLKNKQEIEDLFKTNSEYNRTEKQSGSIMYDPIGLMRLTNARAAKHNKEVKEAFPTNYEDLLVYYIFLF